MCPEFVRTVATPAEPTLRGAVLQSKGGRTRFAAERARQWTCQGVGYACRVR
jgi:hypothetical protein